MTSSTTLLTHIFEKMHFNAQDIAAILEYRMSFGMFQTIGERLQQYRVTVQLPVFFGLFSRNMTEDDVVDYVNQFLFDNYSDYYGTLAFNRLNSENQFEEIPTYFHFGYLLAFFNGDHNQLLQVWKQRLEQGAYTYVNHIPFAHQSAVVHMLLNVLGLQTTEDEQIDMLYYMYDHFDKNDILTEWPQYHANGHALFDLPLITELLPLESITPNHPLWTCVPHDQFFDLRVMIDVIDMEQQPLIFDILNDVAFEDIYQYPEAFMHYLQWLHDHPGDIADDIEALIDAVPTSAFEGCDSSLIQQLDNLKATYAS